MDINRTAANSLLEGLEETLTLLILGVSEELRKSLSTTDIEKTMNRIKNYKKLKLLEKALMDYVNINCKKFSYENGNSSTSTKFE